MGEWLQYGVPTMVTVIGGILLLVGIFGKMGDWFEVPKGNVKKRWWLSVSGALIIILMILFIIWANHDYQIPPFGGNETPAPTITMVPTFTEKQQAKNLVIDYYQKLSEEKYDDAYALLDPSLKEVNNFKYLTWDDHVRKTTFSIVDTDDIRIYEDGDIFRLYFELSTIPRGGRESLDWWTVCVTHDPKKGKWLIKRMVIGSEQC